MIPIGRMIVVLRVLQFESEVDFGGISIFYIQYHYNRAVASFAAAVSAQVMLYSSCFTYRKRSINHDCVICVEALLL